MNDGDARGGPMDGPPVWRRNEPESPCINVCVIHPGAGICIGCHRTGREIAAWPSLSADERREIMDELPSREGRLRAAGARPSRRRGRRQR